MYTKPESNSTSGIGMPIDTASTRYKKNLGESATIVVETAMLIGSIRYSIKMILGPNDLPVVIKTLTYLSPLSGQELSL